MAPPTIASVRLDELKQTDSGNWARFLPDLLRPIESCITAVPGLGIRVHHVRLDPAGEARIRVINSERQSFECRLTATGEVRVDVLGSAPRTPGEDTGPILSLFPTDPPAGECYEHVQVLAEGGRSIGWLSYDTC